ncbi:LacI family DNA-binding transcriptional regulator [Microbacteriaceae bacterium VKM Ac-2854]|nr:LacI family DNA-binding transcriptional regulator [Microbacteriaceae bacterium VKM Ac-2854]
MTTQPNDVGRPSGRRLPTMRDLAAHVGVSRQLVSLVMRGAPGPSPATRERVLAAADELGYHANASARLLAQTRTHLVGALFNLRNPFESRVVERLSVRAPERGFRVVLAPVTDEHGTERLIGEMLEQRIEALVGFITASEMHVVDRVVGMIPVVVLGERAQDDRFDNVHIDDAVAMRLAVDHLVAFGHRDIAYLGGADGAVARDRDRGYREAMASTGLAERIDVVGGTGWGEEDGARAARELLSRERLPTAIVCCSDTSALGVLAVFWKAGVRVPEDISVIGFDDSYVAALSYNALTSIRQDVDSTVAETVESMIERIADPSALPRSVLTAPVLTQRSSTGPARSDP